MLTSDLNKLIEVEKYTLTKSDVGTPKETYTHLFDCYANLYIKGGNTVYNAETTTAQTSAEWKMRFDSRIDYKCRIKYNGELYKILHIEEIGRLEGLKITTIKFQINKY